MNNLFIMYMFVRDILQNRFLVDNSTIMQKFLANNLYTYNCLVILQLALQSNSGLLIKQSNQSNKQKSQHRTQKKQHNMQDSINSEHRYNNNTLS